MGRGNCNMGTRKKRYQRMFSPEQTRLDFRCPKCGGQLVFIKDWESKPPKSKHILVSKLYECSKCGKKKRYSYAKRKVDNK